MLLFPNTTTSVLPLLLLHCIGLLGLFSRPLLVDLHVKRLSCLCVCVCVRELAKPPLWGHWSRTIPNLRGHFYLRGQQSRPCKSDLGVVGLANYAHCFHTATVRQRKICMHCVYWGVPVCVRMCIYKVKLVFVFSSQHLILCTTSTVLSTLSSTSAKNSTLFTSWLHRPSQ